MRFFAPAYVSSDVTGAPKPRTRSGYLALAVGAATLMVGTVALAGDTDGTDNGTNAKAVANAGAPEAAEATGATGATEAAETPSTQKAPDAAVTGSAQADHHKKADGHKTNSKDHKSGPTGDVDSEIIVEGKQQEAQVQHCVPVQGTGSRLRKTVCTTVAQQKANDKNSEQQAQDYLRRLSQQGSLAPSNPSPFIQSGIP